LGKELVKKVSYGKELAMESNLRIAVSSIKSLRTRRLMNLIKHLILTVAGLGAVMALTASPAHATASFSRQTGMACNSCHTTFPELTPFGRDFKLNGYTLSAAKEITDKSDKKTAGLSILEALPFSINIRAAYTDTGNRVPGTKNNSLEFPQQVNFWYAGKITDHIGSYTQMTYSVTGNHFSFDNSDFIRYSRSTKVSGKNLVWGIDGNDDPTFEDLWASTPAYGFPWAAPDANVAPNAAALIDNSLGGDVLGLGAYAMWNDHLYGDVTLYRSQHLGGPEPATGIGFAHNIKDAAPYWRFAWQGSKGNNYLEVGTYGIFAASFPGTLSSTTSATGGPTDKFTDTAADLSYERKIGKADLFVVHSTFIYEKQDLDATFAAGAAARTNHDLRTFRLDADYHFGTKYTLLAGPFITTGTADGTLYSTGAPVTGSANGKPNNKGAVAQFAYWPMQNIEFGLQYRAYTTFNGAGTNYDGLGRNASGNNTTYAFVWLSF
jgi:hypothetical protein